MVKPFEPEHLLSHIRDIQEERSVLPQAQAPVKPHVQSLDERLGSLFLTIGIPAHIKGYQFLRCGVKMVIEQPDRINRITKELYPSIARQFGTTASKVERAIRHAIEGSLEPRARGYAQPCLRLPCLHPGGQAYQRGVHRHAGRQDEHGKKCLSASGKRGANR